LGWTKTQITKSPFAVTYSGLNATSHIASGGDPSSKFPNQQASEYVSATRQQQSV
jgi:hypothetical protein